MGKPTKKKFKVEPLRKQGYLIVGMAPKRITHRIYQSDYKTTPGQSCAFNLSTQQTLQAARKPSSKVTWRDASEGRNYCLVMRSIHHHHHHNYHYYYCYYYILLLLPLLLLLLLDCCFTCCSYYKTTTTSTAYYYDCHYHHCYCYYCYLFFFPHCHHSSTCK